MERSLEFFFDGWDSLLRVAVVGTLSYFILTGMLRVAGPRTLARMNAFDFAIIVAIGATYGRLITAEDVTLAEAAVAFTLLIGLQVALSHLSVTVPRITRLVTPHPVLIYYRGQYLPGNMRRERVTEEELRTAVREHGLGSMEDVEVIAVETNGRLSVVPRSTTGNGSALGELRTEGKASRLDEVGES